MKVSFALTGLQRAKCFFLPFTSDFRALGTSTSTRMYVENRELPAGHQPDSSFWSASFLPWPCLLFPAPHNEAGTYWLLWLQTNVCMKCRQTGNLSERVSLLTGHRHIPWFKVVVRAWRVAAARQIHWEGLRQTPVSWNGRFQNQMKINTDVLVG